MRSRESKISLESVWLCVCEFKKMNEGRDVIIYNQYYCIMEMNVFVARICRKPNERK